MSTTVTLPAARRLARPGEARTLPCAGRVRGNDGTMRTRDFMSPGECIRTTDSVVEQPAG